MTLGTMLAATGQGGPPQEGPRQPAAPFRPPPLSHWHWIAPAVLIGAGTVAIRLLDLDLAVARAYYSAAGPPNWPQGFLPPWGALYQWGILPSILLAVLGLGLLAAGLAGPRRRQRWAGLVLLLSLLVGPLLLVNGALQDYWGRPRPRQVQEFGGNRDFVPVLQPTGRRDEPSFPSGHAGAGFSLLIPYFVLRRARPRLAWLALAAGIALGCALGWARIAQGGHWLSDGLWSGAVVYFSALGITWGLTAWFRRAPATPAAQAAPSAPLAQLGTGRLRAGLCWSTAAALAAALLAFYFMDQPIQRQSVRELPLPAGVRTVHLSLAGPINGYRLQERTGGLRVYAALSGRGLPWTALKDELAVAAPTGPALQAEYNAHIAAWRDQLSLRLVVGAPPGIQVQVTQAPKAP